MKIVPVLKLKNGQRVILIDQTFNLESITPDNLLTIVPRINNGFLNDSNITLENYGVNDETIVCHYSDISSVEFKLL
ncbi:hypothetical protein [Paenibacillus odorifer]|uniref:hypothetical protein n=1 Tax=Paenibacillus odorifer TaxID=189426 RepID=UPI00096CAA2E|nr:hypothetical protein [Paenibacillus odorifer]OMD78249.1 hypothetical protein BSK50_10905 [Paenibacillus odorifer]